MLFLLLDGRDGPLVSPAVATESAPRCGTSVSIYVAGLRVSSDQAMLENMPAVEPKGCASTNAGTRIDASYLYSLIR